MSQTPPPPGEMTPPGPPIEPEPEAHRTDGLETWLEAQHAVARPAQTNQYGSPPNPYDAPTNPYGMQSRSYEPAPSRKMAGWALGLSLAFCIPFAFLVALGLSIAVLVKSRDGRDHGKGMAIAALVISVCLLLANVAYIVIVVVNGVLNGWDETERDADGRVVESGMVSLEKLRVGDCYMDPDARDVLEHNRVDEPTVEVEVVPCRQPHQLEVFHIVKVAGDDFPGTTALDRRAGDCFAGFKDYVGSPYGRSKLEFIYYPPSEISWRLGDREIVCSAVERLAEERTGSVRGTKR